MGDRTYNQFCALAFALDVIGERWTLLIIRELLTGPRRFKDLLRGLPDISTNLLTERLKKLEEHGVLHRRTLPPPAGSTVYELTDFGRGVETAVLELGKWGSQLLPPSLEGLALPSLGTAALAIKAFFHQHQAAEIAAVYQLHLDDEILCIEVHNGVLTVQQGEAPKPDAVFDTTMETFIGLFAGHIQPAEAIAAGLVRIDGDELALSELLKLTSVQAAPTQFGNRD